MIYQITADDISSFLCLAFWIVFAAVILGVFCADFFYAFFSFVFRRCSLEPTERDVNQRILAGAARLRAERKASEAGEVSE